MKAKTDHGEKFVSSFLKRRSNASMRELVNYASCNELGDDTVLHLANGLARSGSMIKIKDKVYDIPSTGGPSSLSTLLCPLLLRAFGKKVLKLGIAGRPAGGIDVLYQINGYNISLTKEQIIQNFHKTGYVHFIADSSFTPLDSLLFKYRRENDAISIPSLVIASLLSKKIAVGLSNVGLDVRVSSFGNFGRTWQEARINSLRFVRISRMAGIRSICYLTNGEIPQQPYIGRGESLLALYKIFSGTSEINLETHYKQCVVMANSFAKSTNQDNIHLLARDIFYTNIQSQGGSINSFLEIAMNTAINHKSFIYAEKDGFIKVDLKLIRDAIVRIQQNHTGLFPDPCGVILISSQSGWFKKGAAICSYRCSKEHEDEFVDFLKNAFLCVNEDSNKLIFEIIDHG